MADDLFLDPVLPTELSDLTMTYRVFDQPVKIHFHEASKEQVLINGQPVDYTLAENSYRKGAFCLDKSAVLPLFNKEINHIDIYR